MGVTWWIMEACRYDGLGYIYSLVVMLMGCITVCRDLVELCGCNVVDNGIMQV